MASLLFQYPLKPETIRFILWITCSVLLLIAESFIVQTQAFVQQGSIIALAMTIDICCGLPLLYWFFVARPRKLEVITVLPVLFGGMIAARLIIPTAHHQWLTLVEYAAIVGEMMLFVYGITKIRAITRHYKTLDMAVRRDFILNLRESLHEVIGLSGRFAAIVVSEISMLRYAVVFWKGGVEYLPEQQTFSTYKHSSYIALMSTLLSVALVETVGVHILLVLFANTTIALIVTALGVYTLLFFVADMVATVRRPIVVEHDALCIRVGLRWNAYIPFSAIHAVHTTLNNNEKELFKAAAFSTVVNVLMEFSEPIEFTGLYGITKHVHRAALSIDDVQGFLRLMNEKCPQLQGYR